MTDVVEGTVGWLLWWKVRLVAVVVEGANDVCYGRCVWISEVMEGADDDFEVEEGRKERKRREGRKEGALWRVIVGVSISILTEQPHATPSTPVKFYFISWP